MSEVVGGGQFGSGRAQMDISAFRTVVDYNEFGTQIFGRRIGRSNWSWKS